ncbi:MAG: macro domain-containing protein [Trueperaceae bacterium]|nr:macro domain-containing protein [Trueperaceae bacterium]
MTYEHDFGSVTVRLVRGDIAGQPDADAIVNAANAELLPGGGVAGAIHRAAGPGLADEAGAYAPIEPGRAVLTGGHDLPNPYVIHMLGPRYGIDQPADRLLADGYREALSLADAEGLRIVATPAVSTGAFGYPLDEAARVALRTVADLAPRLASVREVRFVLYDEHDLEAFGRALSEIATHANAFVRSAS